jgi:hypothetical protein
MAGWYIRRGEKIVGPVEKPKLQELAAAGRLVSTDQLAKDLEGPWKEAGSTSLFARPEQAIGPAVRASQAISLAPKPEVPPPVVVEKSEPQTGNEAVAQTLRAVHVVFGGVGRGMIASWGAVSRTMATRSQRKHELKLAKIQAGALKSQHPPAPQPRTAPRAQQQPADFAPQIHQTTVVQVVNKNKQSVYGCSGCSVLLLLILIGLFVLIVASTPTTP